MLPTLFLSHGSPMTALRDSPARRFFQGLGATLGRPKAILVASAHWETARPAVNAVAVNDTIHDFGGFPRALHEMQYPAPGAPDVAVRVAECLAAASLPCDIDRDGECRRPARQFIQREFACDSQGDVILDPIVDHCRD